jgi:glycosyltransferase involved in cell wall biosynthesis
MTKKPTVSIILPSYNQGQYIAETIDSVLAQIFDDFELIIIDNASTDNSAKVIKQYSDKRIHFLANKENIALVGSLNKGIDLAKGKYIAYICADDKWHRDKLTKQVQYLDTHQDISAIFTRVQVINQSGNNVKIIHPYQRVFSQKLPTTATAWLQQFFFRRNCLCFPSILIRSDIQKKVGKFDPRHQILLDLDMWVRILKNYQIDILEEKLTYFRTGASSFSSSSIAYDICLFESPLIYAHYLHMDDSLFAQIFDTKTNLTLEDKIVLLINKSLATNHEFHTEFACQLFYQYHDKLIKNNPAFAGIFFNKRKVALQNKIIRQYKKLGFVQKAKIKFKTLIKNHIL